VERVCTYLIGLKLQGPPEEGWYRGCSSDWMDGQACMHGDVVDRLGIIISLILGVEE
jgi:hypothetical protein